jgi:hypothetical protein
MDIARLVALVGGVAIVGFATAMSLRTFMLPGPARLASRLVVYPLGRVFSLASRFARDPGRRDTLLALFAPTALLTVVAVLVAMLGAGYALLFYGAGAADLPAALALSASSVSTLGFANPGNSPALVVLSVLAAMSAAATIALLIGYLPTVFQAFQEREQAIATLEAHVGDAASAVDILREWAAAPGLDHAGPLWAEWTTWFAALRTSHASLAGVLFLRSPSPGRSWVAVVGAVLDAAALATTTLDGVERAAPTRCLKAGAATLGETAVGMRLLPGPLAPVPKAADHAPPPISVGRDRFDAACDALAAAGLPVVADRDAAWAAFARARAAYDAPLTALAALKHARVALASTAGEAEGRKDAAHSADC